eukprot:m.95860 g.95860  ORF g.95860 m.95860 type:complete len:4292 (+) comp8765_c0_seq1:164-13039(+)
MDPRLEPIARAVGAQFATEPPADVLAHNSAVSSFLGDANCAVLAAINGQPVEFFNELAAATGADSAVVFYKQRPVIIDADNVHREVFITTLSDSPVKSLFHSVKSVYAPLLLSSDKWSGTFDSRLQSLLTELEQGLGSALRSSSQSNKDTDLEQGIVYVEDEAKYWGIKATTGNDLMRRERAQMFQQILQPVARDFGAIDAFSIRDIVELVERCQDVFDDLWKADDSDPYPADRMKRLFDVTSAAIARALQKKLIPLNVWSDSFNETRDELRSALVVCSNWSRATEQLTQHLWPNVAHRWKLGKYQDMHLSDLANRLTQILALRTVHEQLVRLLTADEQRELGTDRVFSGFDGLQPLHYSAYTEPAWKLGVEEFERKMRPAEATIASHLRTQFGNLKTTSPHQLLREFQRYQELIRRPSIATALISERESLLSQLLVYIKALSEEFQERLGGGGIGLSRDSGPLATKNMPSVVNTIVWCKQLACKVKETLTAADALLGDLSSMAQFSSLAMELLDEIQTHEKEQFADWSQSTQAALDAPGDGTLALETTGRLMEFDHKDGKLRVHYSDGLVSLLRAVRQLSALGYAIPGKIQLAANTAKKFYRHGVVLKQVAHFYNNIDNQIIESQYIMLEAHARALEEVIRNPQGQLRRNDSTGSNMITWDNPHQLEAYINQLQSAASRLTAENRKLRKYHETFTERVCNLMTTDLLRQQSKWKEGLNELRQLCEQLQQQGFSGESMRPWKLHWDHQLYKALEHQYQMGLEGLNEMLPEIKVDLVFRQQTLQFRPPLEEIRAKYYRELKKFLTIPERFGGLAESGIFKAMIDNNAAGFATVYRKAEALFARLAKALEHFRPWVVLGVVNLNDLVEENLNDVEQWEANFRALKVKGREAEQKLPSTIKIDCITVNCAPVKSSVDDHIQQLFDALLNSLRKAIHKDLRIVDEFVESGTDALAIKPQSVEEIGEANGRHAELSKRKPEMNPLFESAESKNRLLRSVAGGGVDLETCRARWEKFDLLLESHALMIKDQVEVLKTGVANRVDTFNQALLKFASRWEALKPQQEAMEDRAAAAAAVTTIKERRTELDELIKEANSIKSDCAHFGVEEPNFDRMGDVEQDLLESEQFWLLFDEFSTGVKEYEDEEWIAFRGRMFVFSEFLDNWIVKLKNLPNQSMASVQIRKDVERYQTMMGLLKYVRGDGFSPDHWVELYKILGLDRSITFDKLTFSNILAVADEVIAHEAELKDLHHRAQGEITIREALQELELWAAGANFSLTSYDDCKGRAVPLIKDWKDLVNKVGDNQSLLQSLKDSPYYKNFADKASLWESKLADLDEYLGYLKTIQRKWVYLEPIFGRGALPKEQSRFQSIDKDFRAIMSDIKRQEQVIALVSHTGLRGTLQQLVDQLTRCQKALTEFLEEKRAIFPRFYFIGDEDLLEILGQSANPVVIQSHLKKLFAGIHSVVFNKDNTSITAMKSQDGEVVPLKTPVKLCENVEVWLGQLATSMKDTLATLLRECFSKQDPDPSVFPSQVLCIAEQLRFTERAEKAIEQRSLPQLKVDLEAQLASYTNVEIVPDDEQSNVLSLKLKALILDIIHMIEVVTHLIEANTASTRDFLWQKQLRYYMGKDKFVQMRMCDAEFDYTYEYQGNAPKLVHTPLTDKCYLTLTQGMHLGYGGNPYGPAGTGKTESVKALGNAFGRQVLVFNCDEGIDVNSMGRIFVGIVKCGAWGCFDEFNRLEELVLSAVSMQIQAIQAAVKNRDPTAQLLSRDVPIDPNSGIFITMNPAGKGYGGRQKLPDNLKALFRPIAMTKPDLEQIAQVILFSEGFRTAKELGRKLVALYNLSRELLSPQQHYDWGLRALKTSLRGGGHLLQKYRIEQGGGSGAISPSVEMEIIVQAVRVNTLSKLTFNDSSRFDALVRDIFPDVTMSDVQYPKLVEAMKEVCEEMKLVFTEAQAKKMIELYEQLRQRMGCVIVGPSGSGKTTLWRILRAALLRTGSTIKTYVMNPKAIPRQQLLGSIDMDTREWTDGILTYSARQVVKEPLDVQSWIICDGDIDPEWIESLNSVLDDNRLLTMPSGERIQFGPNVNFIFETHDLSSASPATISRMGMIFFSEEDINIKAIVTTWLQRQDEMHRSKLELFVEDFFYRALDWVSKNSAHLIVPQSIVGLAHDGLSQVRRAENKAEFACGLIRGLGGNLDEQLRERFIREVCDWIGESVSSKDALNVRCVDGRLSTYSSNGVSELSLAELLKEPLIMTKTSQRVIDVVTPWLEDGEPFVLVGPEGCGKANLLKNCLATMRSTSVAVLHCNAQTTPQDLLQKLQQMCMVISTNTGRVYRPKEGERLVVFLKDINIPKPDKWGTSPLIELLQQFIGFRGFYDSNLEWVGLENIMLVGSMNPSSTLGRHDLSERFSSIVRVLYVDYTETDQLQEIYTACLASVLNNVTVTDRSFKSSSSVSKLAATMISIYQTVREAFKSDEHGHYLFTPLNLTEWCRGMLRYNLAEVEVLEAFCHEASRIFRDRLVEEDRIRFDDIVRGAVRVEWGYSLPSERHFFTTLGSAAVEGDMDSSTISKEGQPFHKYSHSTLTEVVSKGLTQYSREFRDLDLLLFDEMLELVTSIDRVLSRPGGSLLLAGLAGVGRRSLVTLVAYMHGIEIFSPKITLGYSLKSFQVDLKTVLHRAGVEGQPTVLLLEDFQLLSSSFTELINSLLSTGEVPGLYRPEELDPLLLPLKDEASEQGWRGSLLNFMISRVRRNLHVVLVLDASREEFSYTCESNPAFLKNATLLWMDRWHEASMAQVPRMLLGDDFLADNASCTMPQLVQKINVIHEECASLGATPRHFTQFVHMYKQIHKTKLQVLNKQQGRLQAGLTKLQEASSRVDDLKAKAKKQSALLSAKQKEANEALEEITASMAQAGQQKSEVELVKRELAQEERALAERKRKIEKDLSQVQPLLDAARKAVNGINPKTLGEIRALRAPPEAIRDILQAVLLLMGVYDTSWVSMRSFLAKRDVINDICSFNAGNISEETRDMVNRNIQEHAKSFEPANAKRASKAAAPLAEWVQANLEYSRVFVTVAPLQEENDRLQRDLDVSQSKLDDLVAQLSRLDDKVAKLRERFQVSTNESAKLQLDVDQAQAVISSAESLIGKLDGERTRWAHQVNELGKEIEKLPQLALLAAAFSVYLPGTAEDVRASMLRKWCMQAGIDEQFDFAKFMTPESVQLKWKSEGLPSDPLSIENAVVLLDALQAPYLIDPASRAVTWLKKHLTGGRLEVVNHQDSNFVTQLELAVRFGKTLIVQELDSIEPLLYPVLRKDLIAQGPRFCVQIGDKMVDYHDEFRLIMATRNPQPEIPPDARAIITMVNFTITREGLAGQLLARTIAHEKPELEVRRSELLQSEENMKMQLAELEETLLAELAAAEGNILENKTLLDSLNETKAKSSVISESLAESTQLQAALDKDRNLYLPLAQQASLMYFVIADLAKIRNMYQFSLASYMRLFQRALESRSDGAAGSASSSSSSPDVRLKLLMHCLQQLVYAYVTRSLFKADRLMFALHLAHGMQPSEFEKGEWEHFCGIAAAQGAGGAASSAGFDSPQKLSGGSNSVPSWVNPAQAGATQQLLTAFPSLGQALNLRDADLWSLWARDSECEKNFPGDVLRKIRPFQQLLVVQALRPDRLQSAMAQFACRALGIQNLQGGTDGGLLQIYENESTPSEPILIMVSSGSDPSEDLQELANKIVGSARFHQVAMGQGQSERAMQALRDCARDGDWLCLKNLHLVTPWLQHLEKELNSLTLHKDFRLWLTTEEHPKFPPVLLRSSLKLSYESPPGVKRNLARSFETYSREFFSSGGSVLSQALFVLAWLHAIVQERRLYIPQGWTKFYEFSMSDLRVSAEIVARVCREAAAASAMPKWVDVIGLLSAAVYGGRVDNAFDHRTLVSYLNRFFNDDIIRSGNSNRGTRARLAPGITLPTSTHMQDYLDVIKNLPEVDQPDLFGLPQNVDRLLQRTISGEVIAQLKVLMRADTLAHRFDRELWQRELAPILDQWHKLMQGRDLLDSRIEFPKQNDDPLKAFVALERANALLLVRRVEEDLSALRRVLKGSALLTPALMGIAQSLLIRSTPAPWLRAWDGPEDSSVWCRNLVKKTMALGSWAERAAAGTLLKTPIDFSQLFHPDVFLNALRQQTARIIKCSIDNLRCDCSWLATGVSGSMVQVPIDNLMLEGCIFDGTRLSETQRESSSVNPAPKCHIAWVPNDSPPAIPPNEAISLPVYFTPAREKIVTRLSVPCGSDASKWMLSGAAFYLKDNA